MENPSNPIVKHSKLVHFFGFSPIVTLKTHKNSPNLNLILVFLKNFGDFFGLENDLFFVLIIMYFRLYIYIYFLIIYICFEF